MSGNCYFLKINFIFLFSFFYINLDDSLVQLRYSRFEEHIDNVFVFFVNCLCDAINSCRWMHIFRCVRVYIYIYIYTHIGASIFVWVYLGIGVAYMYVDVCIYQVVLTARNSQTLTIRPHHPSPPVDLLDCTQYSHRVDVCKSLLVG